MGAIESLGDSPVLVGVRFLLEIGVLVAVGYWGYQIGGSGIARIGLAVGLPGLVAVIWGLVGAPAAPYRLESPWRVGVELVLFGAATGALYAVDRQALAIGFGVLALLTTILLNVNH